MEGLLLSSRSSINVGHIHDPNELAKQNETQRLRDRNYGCQERWGRLGGGTVRELETDVYKLLYLKWITKKNNKVDNQEGPTVPLGERCSVICGSLRGRGVRGEGLHVYVWLSPFTVLLKLSHLC